MLLPLRRTYFGGIAESRNDSSVVVGASEANQSPAQVWRLLLSQRTLHRNDDMVVVSAGKAKQSPAQVWRLLLSQRTLYRNDGMVVVPASEAVSRSGMEIASFVKSAPTLLSLRAKRSSLTPRHGDSFYRAERSIAMTARLLSLQAKQSPAQLWRLLLSQRALHRNDGMFVVTAIEAKQSPTRISKLFYSMYTINGYYV